jgi:hypothetical protein
MRQRLGGAAWAALTLAPFAALVATWGGLVPPSSDPASCGLCTDRPGVGRDALTLRTVGFTLGVFGLYAAAIYVPVLVQRRPRLRLPRLALPAAVGVVLLLISPLAYTPPVPGEPGDAGYLWRAARHLPDLAGSELLFWVLVPLGAIALAALALRARLDSLPSVWFGAFLLAALPVRLVYEKYFDPFALLALTLFAKPPDFRRPLDYAGVAVLGVAFVLYALLGGG